LLSLRNNKIADAGFRFLMQSDNFKTLKTLVVEYNQISEEGALSLTASKFLSQLEHLDIGQNEIGNIGAQVISSCMLSRLNFMSLKHNNIGEPGYKCLAESETMPLLQTLHIYPGNNAVSMEAKKSLLRSKFLRSLNNVS
jgi:hypothetical protein